MGLVLLLSDWERKFTRLRSNESLQDGFNALMMAAQGGHVEVVDCLLRRGADVNASNEVTDKPRLLRTSMDCRSKGQYSLCWMVVVRLARRH